MAKSKIDQSNHPLPIVNRWDELPIEWVKVQRVKEVDLEGGLESPGLLSLVTPFIERDTFRLRMNGLYVDPDVDVMCATDAHKLLVVPNYGVKKGLWNFNPKSQPLYSKIDATYPDYPSVLPKQGIAYKIDLLKLKTYCKAALNGDYVNKTTNAIHFNISKKKNIAFNGKFLVIVCDAMLKLGHRMAYVGFADKIDNELVGNENLITISPDEKTALDPKKYMTKHPFVLLMKVMSDDETKLGAHESNYNISLNPYFSFSKNAIINADGSIAKVELPDEDEEPSKPAKPSKKSPRQRKTEAKSSSQSQSTPPAASKKAVLERIKSLHLAKKYATAAEKKAITERNKALTISLKYL